VSPNITIIPVRIPGPPCTNCIATIRHDAEMIFYEERDRVNTVGFPKPAAGEMKYTADCQWTLKRNDRAFQALAKGVCIAIELKSKTTQRKFMLERLKYGYKGPDGVHHPADKYFLYDGLDKKKPSNAALVYAKWDNTLKMMQIRFSILATGQLERLQYSAQVRLCELATPYVPNVCKIPVKAGKFKTEFTDIDFTKKRTRVLADGTTMRVLANEDKEVVASYNSEETYVGESRGLKSVDAKKDSGSGAVIGAVVGVGVLGGLGLAGWMF